MPLPLEKQVRKTELHQQKILVYGRPKIGKSTFCSFFPNTLFLATEPGLNWLDVASVNITSWEKFLDTCAEIAKGSHPYKTIIIDTLDGLKKLCDDWVCRSKEIDEIGNYKKFGAYHITTSEMSTKIMKLSLLPYGLVCVSHVKDVEVETKTKKYNRQTVDLSGGISRELLKLFDIILFMDSEMKDGTEVGMIRTKPSIYFEAGDKSKLLPEVIEYPLIDPQKAFVRVNGYFVAK